MPGDNYAIKGAIMFDGKSLKGRRAKVSALTVACAALAFTLGSPSSAQADPAVDLTCGVSNPVIFDPGLTNTQQQVHMAIPEDAGTLSPCTGGDTDIQRGLVGAVGDSTAPPFPGGFSCLLGSATGTAHIKWLLVNGAEDTSDLSWTWHLDANDLTQPAGFATGIVTAGRFFGDTVVVALTGLDPAAGQSCTAPGGLQNVTKTGTITFTHL